MGNSPGLRGCSDVNYEFDSANFLTMPRTFVSHHTWLERIVQCKYNLCRRIRRSLNNQSHEDELIPVKQMKLV